MPGAVPLRGPLLHLLAICSIPHCGIYITLKIITVIIVKSATEFVAKSGFEALQYGWDDKISNAAHTSGHAAFAQASEDIR
ncbi:hypothetical protein N7457_006173 [Penicillium paradoxum]|uniref:uncharacterized protein n=1 Tax=Penicillium paradoxum TaxID=176176 RepID=UPI002548C62C|nr:uncharacterized protein N7457_006173 [Penicillium paradoxum]KAJ5781013.1 hypothetical protein N7457_006173 [Penicillium paradoxum]